MKQNAKMTTPPAWLPNEERQQDRRAVNVAIVVDEPHRRLSATLIDLSTAGCRLRVSERLSLGAFVTVQLNATCDAKGWVAWSRGLEAGVDFSSMLPDAVVEEVAPAAE